MMSYKLQYSDFVSDVIDKAEGKVAKSAMSKLELKND